LRASSTKKLSASSRLDVGTSGLMVVAMFAVLFRRGAFDFADPSPTAIVMILFWITFAAFFFGLTYGLLQISTERPILRREHLVGVRLSSYLFSKVTVLLPLPDERGRPSGKWAFFINPWFDGFSPEIRRGRVI
jgi:hypothetical protein